MYCHEQCREGLDKPLGKIIVWIFTVGVEPCVTQRRTRKGSGVSNCNALHTEKGGLRAPGTSWDWALLDSKVCLENTCSSIFLLACLTALSSQCQCEQATADPGPGHPAALTTHSIPRGHSDLCWRIFELSVPREGAWVHPLLGAWDGDINFLQVPNSVQAAHHRA